MQFYGWEKNKLTVTLFRLASLFSLLAAVALLPGCREESVIAGNSEGQLNDPVTANQNSYYNFEIAADGLTYHFTDTLKLRTTLSTVAFEVSGYSGGQAAVDVLSSGGTLLYRATIAGDVQSERYALSGSVPRLLQIVFTNFSGRCKINVTGIR